MKGAPFATSLGCPEQTPPSPSSRIATSPAPLVCSALTSSVMIPKSWHHWTATKAASVSPPAAKRSPISLTRKFSKFAISLRSIAWPVFALASASFAGRPTNRVSSSNAPSKRNPAISSGSIFLRSRPRYRGMTFPSRNRSPFPSFTASASAISPSLPTAAPSPSSLPANAISSSSLFPHAESPFLFALFSALSVSSVISVLNLFSLVAFFLCPKNKNPAQNRRGPPINPNCRSPTASVLQLSSDAPPECRHLQSPSAPPHAPSPPLPHSQLPAASKRPSPPRESRYPPPPALPPPAGTRSRSLFSPAPLPAAHNF